MARSRFPEKRLIDAARIRRIRDGFSWIDRRFVREGWAERLSREAVLLYLFLVAVADRDGLSFWGDARVAGTLKLPRDGLLRARDELVHIDLVAYECPLYQVLDIAPRPSPRRGGGPTQSLADILRQFGADKEG